MGIRGLLKKKDKEEELYVGGTEAGNVYGGVPQQQGVVPGPPGPAAAGSAAPEFTFIRSDTFSQEVIHPPSGYYEDDEDASSGRTRAREGSTSGGGGGGGGASLARRSLDVFKSRSRSASTSSKASSRDAGGDRSERRDKDHRLSRRLHLNRTQSTSSNLPTNLPEIVVPPRRADGGGDGADGDDDNAAAVRKEESTAIESQWEKRATILALGNDRGQSRPATPEEQMADLRLSARGERQGANSRNRSSSVVSSKEMDTDIQEAIRLHEEGKLEESTRMFGILADPNGYNNPLSQVLYGLALRHGWGCTPDTATAVKYLSAAASNAATVESLALQAGMKKGGAAKGELVLAIFELANCFRNGWGIDKDPIAAKQYYETAANLGDTDAMNEVAWCYLEGFGCKKDKFTAAKYYRLAEQNGNKTLGNSWIWKDKYDPDKQKKK